MESVFSIYCKLGYNFWFTSSQKNDAHVLTLLGWAWHPAPRPDQPASFTRSDLLDRIVVSDQLTRHFFRGHQEIIDEQTSAAIELAELWISKYQFETREELLFVTLPLRHLPTQDRIDRVVAYIQDFISTHPGDEKFCAKILNATRKRYALYCRNHRSLAKDADGKVLQSEIIEAGDLNGRINPVDPKSEAFRRILPAEKFLISLSGGVDSMVLAALMKATGVPFSAYHINYGRRAEADEEAKFLRDFCETHDIPLVIETINPLSSDILYNWEEATRQKRFSDYLEIGGEGCFVVMGHHIDDTKENLLMNLFSTGAPSGGRYLWNGLNGMPVRHPMRGVVLYRPLIEMGVDKSWVFELAHRYNIPYFRDSSFELATRIRIRRELLPLMRDIFGAKLDSQLLRVVEQGAVLEQTIDNVFEVVLREGSPDILTIDMGRFLASDKPIEIHKSGFMDSIKPYFFERGKNLPSHTGVRKLLEQIKMAPERRIEVFFRGHVKCCYQNREVIISFN